MPVTATVSDDAQGQLSRAVKERCDAILATNEISIRVLVNDAG